MIQEFSTPAQLGEWAGLRLDPARPGEFPGERDWMLTRLRGLGLPGGRAGGWLVTYAHPDESSAISGLITAELAGVPSIAPDTEADGWLVAFAIDPDGQRTGRCLVLAGPWTMQQDQRALHQAQAQVWWPRRLEDEGQPDVEALAAWARG